MRTLTPEQKARNYARAKEWTALNRERVNANKRAWRANNREKSNACSYRWRERNPEHAFYLRRIIRYGLTKEAFLSIRESQDNRCDICKKEFLETNAFDRPHVDHDHATGTVRGLLCRGCNLSIGFLKESVLNCRRAGEYLTQHEVKTGKNS